MDWRLAGQPQTIVMQFVVDGQPVIPDAGSISFSAWNHLGVLIRQGAWEQPDTAVPTQIEIVLETDLNTIDAAALFESRYLRADFKSDSKPYFVKANYALYRMIPMTAEPSNVRGLIGADYEELPDRDIDLVQAYFNLSPMFDTGLLALALVRTDNISLQANGAIALQAAIDVLPSLQARLLKADKIDNAGFTRFTIDFDKLRADLENSLNDKINDIIMVLVGYLPIVNTITLFSMSSQTDRITGEAQA